MSGKTGWIFAAAVAALVIIVVLARQSLNPETGNAGRTTPALRQQAVERSKGKGHTGARKLAAPRREGTFPDRSAIPASNAPSARQELKQVSKARSSQLPKPVDREKLAATAAALQEGAAEEPGFDDSAADDGAPLSISFNNSLTAANGTEPIIARGIEFDSESGAVRLRPDARLAYPDSGGIDPEQGTVAFWVRIEFDPTLPLDGKTLADLRTDTWENRFQLRMGPSRLSFILTGSDGVEEIVSSPLAWEAGEWHHVAATWGEALMSLYVDGAVREQRTYAGIVEIPQDALLYVGSTRTKNNEGTASLRDWLVFPLALAPDEVAGIVSRTVPSQ
jgi:hypothetical protein